MHAIVGLFIVAMDIAMGKGEPNPSPKKGRPASSPCLKPGVSAGRTLMNIDSKSAQITRREALCRLATFPFIASISSQCISNDAINQYAASIAACWELSRGSDESDVALAFDGTSTYLPILNTLMKDAPSKQRKAIASLAAQCALLQTVLGWHFAGLKDATRSGIEAVNYSKQAEDVSLQLSAYKCLAWSYYYDLHDKQAVQTMEQALLLLKQHKTSSPAYAWSNIYSTFALMKARNAQPYIETLKSAEKMARYEEDYPVYVDAPMAAYIRNTGIALYQANDHSQALKVLADIIDPQTFRAKRSFPERTRIEVLNTMTLASVKSSNKDLEYTLKLWEASMQGAKHLQSEQRFSEALHAYDIMEAVWPNDKRIAERRELAMHW